MPHLLDLIDQLIGDVLQGNIYTDTDTFRNRIATPQTPEGAFGHIPNADPRRLNLTPGKGFEHPHKEISVPLADRVIPPDPMHGTYGTFPNPGVAPGAHPHVNQPIPQEPMHGTHGTFGPGPLNPSDLAEHPHSDLAGVIPQSPMHGAPGTFPAGPLNLRPDSDLSALGVRDPIPSQPSSLNLTNVEGHPHKGMANVIPQDPLHDNKDAYSTSEGLIKQAKRRGFYQKGPAPSDITKQTQALQGNAGNPPAGGPPLTDFTTAESPVGRIKTDASNAFYQNPPLAPQSELEKLADFHEAATRPPTTTFTADKRAADSSFPPRSPADNPAATHPGANADITNTFAQTPQRPLNFDVGEEPTRSDLVAGFHGQKFGPNVEATSLPQRHGILNDNLYDDSDIPFVGNFQSVFRGPVPQFLNYFNIIATGHWLRNIADELFIPDPTGGFQGGSAPSPESPDALAQPIPEGITKGVTFIASQFLLTAFNPANIENGISNAVWNPLSITAAIPLAGGIASDITAGAALGFTYKDNVLAAETDGTSRLLLARKGAYSEKSPIHRVSKVLSPLAQPGFLGDITGPPGNGNTLDHQFRDGTPSVLVDIETQVDGGEFRDAAVSKGIHTNIYTLDRPYNKDNAIFPMEKLLEAATAGTAAGTTPPETQKLADMFNFKTFPGGDSQSVESLPSSPVPGTWVAKRRTDDGINAQADAPGIGFVGVVSAQVTTNDSNADAAVNDGLADKIIDDANVYMPFMFEDLRDNQSKFLYFRAFLKGDINETFTPEWQIDRYYGRVDAVPIYKGTNRTLNFTFDIAAFKPTDLKIIWQKLYKLQSMVYPSYDADGFIAAGPLIRLRIGDLFAASGQRGLPGYITGMDWSFPDGIWHIEKDFKVPRLITVAISFTVVHSGNPGIYHEASELTATGELISSQEGVFGAGAKFDANSDFIVSPTDVRKIFGTVR